MRRRIAVIGGGITGLSAAHRIIEMSGEEGIDAEVLLFEQSSSLGGVISTIKKDGFLIEEGPDSFITTKPWALDLALRLGLEPELIKTNERMRRTLILRDKKLYPIPEGFMLLAPTRITPFLRSPLISWKGKFRMLLDLILPAKVAEDESLGSFVRRRLGEEALIRIAQPMISGIYTADPDKLSLRSTMPQFLEMERRFGSIIKGMYSSEQAKNKNDSGARYSAFLSFKDGLDTLVTAITQRLSKGSMQLNRTVQKVSKDSGAWNVVTDEGETKCSDVILTTPSYISGTLLKECDPTLSAKLNSIEYASSAVIIQAYAKKHIEHPLDGFGFVVPAIENSSLLACSYSSVKFQGRAPDDYALVRCFTGGAMNPGILELPDGEIIKRMEDELSQLLNISSPPEFSHIKRYPRAMPQYHVGHHRLVQDIKTLISKHNGLEIAGNAFEGVGIPDCIRSGEKAAEAVFDNIVSRQ